ncbi:MAG TPA: hydrogenase maturation protease [Nitrososphaerales archaeon]|nr:hydrogenase maturation protease [Nitrososphaerales archaeon]
MVIADGRNPVHLMGVGNELRTDDAVGLEIASSLRRKLGMTPAPGVKIYTSTPAPERLLSRLASARGRIVVFDAVEASATPGEVVFRCMADTQYGFFGTHNIPLRLVPGLEGRLGDVLLVGVQPATLEVGWGLSEAVSESVREIVSVVAEGVAQRS